MKAGKLLKWVSSAALAGAAAALVLRALKAQEERQKEIVLECTCEDCDSDAAETLTDEDRAAADEAFAKLEAEEDILAPQEIPAAE